MRGVLALQHGAGIMRVGHLHLLLLTRTITFSLSSTSESELGRPLPLEKSFLEKLWMLSLSCWLALRCRAEMSRSISSPILASLYIQIKL